MPADVNGQYLSSDYYTNGTAGNTEGNDHLYASAVYEGVQPPRVTPVQQDAPSQNGSNPESRNSWRASPYLTGAEGIFAPESSPSDQLPSEPVLPTQDATNPPPQSDGLAQNEFQPEPWRAEPYLDGAQLPGQNNEQTYNNNNNNDSSNNNGLYPEWQPQQQYDWNSPGPAPEYDASGNLINPPPGNGVVSPELKSNLQQSLAPRYGFDGVGPQMTYLLSGGIGGAFGKTVLQSVLKNNSAWWLDNAVGTPTSPVNTFGPRDTGSLKGNLSSGFVEGAAFAALSSGVVDNALDRLLNRKDHKDSWHLSGLAVPLAFSSSTNLLTKVGLGVGSIVAGKALDTILPASEHKEFSQLFAPTAVEGLTMGAAWALPAPSNVKLPIVAGTWLFNRMANLDTPQSVALAAVIGAGSYLLNGRNLAKTLPILAIDAAGWVGSRLLHRDQTDNAAIDADASKLVEQDKSSRSFQSMNAAIDKYVELGKEKDFVLRSYYEDILSRDVSQFDDLLTGYRNVVTVAAAFGESRLNSGTAVLPADQPTFILQGQNLDLGGRALTALTLANIEADEAKSETEKLLGQTNHGTDVTSSELDGLSQIQERIDANLSKIYGKHDLQRAVTELSDFQKSNQVGFARLEMDLLASLSINDHSQPKVTAKLFRDYALLCLTYASLNAEKSPANAAAVLYGNDTGRQIPFNDGTPRGFDGAIDAVRLAGQLDPENPDNLELQSIVADLESKIPRAQQAQDANPLYNPLQISNAG